MEYGPTRLLLARPDVWPMDAVGWAQIVGALCASFALLTTLFVIRHDRKGVRELDARAVAAWHMTSSRLRNGRSASRFITVTVYNGSLAPLHYVRLCSKPGSGYGLNEFVSNEAAGLPVINPGHQRTFKIAVGGWVDPERLFLIFRTRDGLTWARRFSDQKLLSDRKARRIIREVENQSSKSAHSKL